MVLEISFLLLMKYEKKRSFCVKPESWNMTGSENDFPVQLVFNFDLDT